MMIGVRLGKGQGLAYKAGQALTKAVVPTLHVRRLAGFLAHAAMGFFGKSLLIGLPEIAETVTAFIGVWNLAPQAPAGGQTSITDDEGHDLAGAATHSGPQPALVVLFQHERPHFIYFQHILRLHGQQRVLHVGQSADAGSDPTRHSLSRYPEDAFQSTHAGPFLIRAQDRIPLLLSVGLLGLQHPIGATAMAMILRVAAFVGTVSDNIGAFANMTVIGYGYLYHAS